MEFVIGTSDFFFFASFCVQEESKESIARLEAKHKELLVSTSGY